MKLSDWAKKEGIKYLTAYRWFKAGKMPVPCYQTESGTIIVDVSEKNMQDDQSNNQAVSQFLKKTVEFSKQNTSIEDFAAYVLSNYKLEKSGVEGENQKGVKTKPTKEMINQHFNQFLKKNEKKPEPNIFLVHEQALETITEASADAASSEEALAKELSSIFDPTGSTSVGTILPVNENYRMMAQNNPNVKLMAQDLGSLLRQAKGTSTVKTLQSLEGGAVVARSVSTDPIDVTNAQPVSGTYLSDNIQMESLTSTSTACNASFTPSVAYNSNDAYYPSSFTKTASEFYLSENDKITYDEARLLVDAMVNLNQVKNDPIQIDRKAKEICTWTRDTFQSILEITMMAVRK